MRTVILDGEDIQNREELHDLLEKELELPEWYGRNLDALFDCLTAELTEETVIGLLHSRSLEEHLGHYGLLFQQVLKEAEEESRNLLVTIIS